MKRLISGIKRSEFARGSCRAALRVNVAMFLLGIFLAPAMSAAAIISLFNFNDMATNNNGTTGVTVENAIGVPTLQLVEDSGLLADLNGQVGVAFSDQAGTNHSSGMAAAWTSGVLNTSADPGDYWLLSVDTTGYRNLVLRFDYRLTSAVVSGEDLQGPTQLTIDWRKGGGSFNTIQTFNLTKDNAYHAFLLDLSGIGAIQNAADVQIRGTWSNNATKSGTSGTFPSARFDNLQLTGLLVPEPASLVMLTCGGICGWAGRQRRQRCQNR